MGSFFANKTTNQNLNQGSSNNTSTSTNPLSGLFTGYGQDVYNTFTGPAPNVPITPYQYGAANNQTGVADPSQLGTAFNTANNVAQNGFAPQMAAFQNPYNDQVIQNLQSDFARQNAETMDRNHGHDASQGALGNLTGADALRMRSIYDSQNKQLDASRQAGFNTAAGLAAQDTGLRLQGAGQAGSLTGAATNANQALGNIGANNIWEQQWKNAAAPGNFLAQGAQTLSALPQGAGITTTSQGTTQNTGYGTTSQQPSPFQIATGIGSMFLKDGGAVKGFEDGGAVHDDKPVMESYKAAGSGHSFVDKVMHAAEHFTNHLKKRDGGAAPGYEAGGITPYKPMDDEPAPAPAASSWSQPAFMNNIAGPTSMVGSFANGNRWNAGKASDLSRAFMATSGPQVMGNAADVIAKINQERLAQQQAEIHLAQLTGQLPNGQQTLAAKQYGLQAAKNPAEIAQLEAASEPAKIRIAGIEGENKLYAQNMEKYNTMQALLNPNAPDYAQQLQQLEQMRAQATVTYQQNMARLQSQHAGTPPPVVKTWSPDRGVQ